MKLYRYYGVGKGESMALSEVVVKSVLKIPFSQTSNDEKEKKKAKLREDRQLCTLLFCPNHESSETFENYEKV